jgi:hypothetical protein
MPLLDAMADLINASINIRFMLKKSLYQDNMKNSEELICKIGNFKLEFIFSLFPTLYKTNLY